MKTIGFYVSGKKGLCALEAFIETFSAGYIRQVVYANDWKIEDDFSEEIVDKCEMFNIPLVCRGEEDISSANCDYRIAAGWRWLISDNQNLVVFHDSPLPRYRGFSPLVNMLIAGHESLGVTALKAVSGYDRGEIIAQEFVDIKYPIKIKEAISIIAELYERLVRKVGRNILNGGMLTGIPQIEENATYSLWRDDSDYRIDWCASAAEIARFVDAVGYPYLGARSVLDDSLVRIDEAKVREDVKVESRAQNIGKTIFIEEEGPVVVCGDGLLAIVSLFDLRAKKVIKQSRLRSRFR